ncbi:hypothetical protein K439DRAFT_1363954 [Ramaria rubella]|nr:hypothetical protein K439DRAFT_1363954 [Ramaria rubella]
MFHSVVTPQTSWTDNDLCVYWFKKVFIPLTSTHNSPKLPILLISNSHASH